MDAIKFTNDIPVQTDQGYDVNLRPVHYARMAFPVDDEAKIPAQVYIDSITPSPQPQA